MRLERTGECPLCGAPIAYWREGESLLVLDDGGPGSPIHASECHLNPFRPGLPRDARRVLTVVVRGGTAA